MLEKEISLLHRFAKKGDAEAFSEIVRRHAGLVYGASLRVLEDKTRAADVVQETFFQLYKDAGRITGSLPIWLHRVATRKAIDVVRKDSRRKRREAKYAADRHREAQTWEDVSGYIDEGLDELDDQTREILIRHFFEGRPMADIANQMSVSQPTISRRVDSGISKLRETLRKRGVIVAAGALISLLAENAVEAAPALVVKELGKIALLGTTVASSGAKTAATGALVGVKAKIVAVTAAAAIGTVGVVAYKDITQPAKEPAAPIVRGGEEPETEQPLETTSEEPRSPEIVRIDREEPPKVTANASDPKDDEDVMRPSGAKAAGDDAPVATGPVGGMGGYGVGGYGGYWAARPKEKPDAEDSNAPEESNEPPPPRRSRRGKFRGGG